MKTQFNPPSSLLLLFIGPCQGSLRVPGPFSAETRGPSVAYGFWKAAERGGRCLFWRFLQGRPLVDHVVQGVGLASTAPDWMPVSRKNTTKGFGVGTKVFLFFLKCWDNSAEQWLKKHVKKSGKLLVSGLCVFTFHTLCARVCLRVCVIVRRKRN